MVMSFDYMFTCGDIDKCLSSLRLDIKEELKDFAERIIENYKESLEDPEVIVLEDLEYFIDRIYSGCEEACEDVRTTNQDMRNEAESQINTVVDEKEDLEDIINDLEIEIEDLKSEVKDRDEEVESLKIELNAGEEY
jgi:chromosome segregation ATPase